MFVAAQFRGKGIGVALATQIIADAEQIGYRTIRLDTSHRQTEAIALYERLGFHEIDAYYEVSGAMRAWLRFFERAV
ncbi:hypothetical protein AXW83_20090 [Bosea sp. PAMC 26642]|nr:hypothetical protein AXW83_20090 [Bosea sp. PAMC 26642]